MPLVSVLIPVETALGIRPRDLHYRERRPPVETDGLPEEGPVPAAINLPERDSMIGDNIRMALAVCQCFACGGLLSEGVEHAVHGVDIEPKHGEFRSAVGVREADRVGESRTDLVFGNHHDVPSVLLHMLDDRQLRAADPALRNLDHLGCHHRDDQAPRPERRHPQLAEETITGALRPEG